MDDFLILLAFGILCVIIGLILKFFLNTSPAIKPLLSGEPVLPAKLEKSPERKAKFDAIAKILIFFGSQSGTAAKYSNILAEEAENNNFDTKVIDLEEFESYKFQENICIFLMATYGEGDPTDNAKQFYKWLKGEPHTKDTLKGLKFSVFGLGNSQYQHFNSMGKNVNKLLEDLGGERIYKYGQGDDNSSLEDDFMAWKEGIWVELKDKILNIHTKTEDIPKKLQKKEVQPLSNFKFVETEEKEIQITHNQSKEREYDFQTKKLLESSRTQISLIKEVRQNLNDGSTLHIEIDIKDTPIKYITAQNVAIFPQNTPEIVEEVAQMLDFQLNRIISVENIGEVKPGRKIKYPFPFPISVKTILTNFCDFQGPIMKKTLKEIAQLPINSELKSKFEFLASNEGKLDYKKEIEERKSSLFSLISQYKLKMSLEDFVALTPRIAPRLFTIASSNLKYPNSLHVTASLLEEVFPDGKSKKGLISQYFNLLAKRFEKGLKQDVLVYFNESNFKLPQNKNAQLIMIGPGTGVAPFRAFLQEKETLLEREKIMKEDMKMYLYSGCRHQDGDYIYREEFKTYIESGLLQGHYMAFSRDQGEKIYVQNLVKKNQDEVYEILKNQQGYIYLCGSTKMGKDVMEVLEDVLILKENKTKEEAKKALNQMETEKILIKELWG